jgi:hypothetical protein
MLMPTHLFTEYLADQSRPLEQHFEFRVHGTAVMMMMLMMFRIVD